METQTLLCTQSARTRSSGESTTITQSTVTIYTPASPTTHFMCNFTQTRKSLYRSDHSPLSSSLFLLEKFIHHHSSGFLFFFSFFLSLSLSPSAQHLGLSFPALSLYYAAAAVPPPPSARSGKDEQINRLSRPGKPGLHEAEVSVHTANIAGASVRQIQPKRQNSR